MNIKKVRLKTDVFMKRMNEGKIHPEAIKAMLKLFDGKIVMTDINESFGSSKEDERIFNLSGWAILGSELEFIEEEEAYIEWNLI